MTSNRERPGERMGITMPSRFYLPANTADDWRTLLADPEKHWRTGYSARSLAYCWMSAAHFPPEVVQALKSARNPALHPLELLAAFPEHQVPLPGGRRPSQNDIWLLARGCAGLVSITVEGKVAEPFDKPVSEWLATASPGRDARLQYLCETIGIDRRRADAVRYQLLHRTASAVIEARRFCCTHAVMLVHSFSQTHDWFADFAAFAELYGADIQRGTVAEVAVLGGVHLSLGWVTGEPAFLSR